MLFMLLHKNNILCFCATQQRKTPFKVFQYSNISKTTQDYETIFIFFKFIIYCIILFIYLFLTLFPPRS